MLHVGAPVVSETGGVLVALLVAVDLGRLGDIHLAPLGVGETGYATMLADEGLVVLSHQSGRLGEAFGDPSLAERIAETARTPGQTARVVHFEAGGVPRSGVVHPMRSRPWIGIGSMERSELFAPVGRMVRRIVLVLAAAILTITALLVLFVRWNLIRRTDAIAHGLRVAAKGNLSRRPALDGSDEIGEMGRGFNRLMSSLSVLVQRVRERMSHLEAQGDSLATSTEQSARVIERINANVERTRELIHDHTINVTETSSTVEEMTRNVESLNGAIQRQPGRIGRSSAAVEQMVRNIHSIESASDQAKLVRTNLRELAGAIGEIGSMPAQTGFAFETVLASAEEVRRVFSHIGEARNKRSAGGEKLLGRLSKMKEISTSVPSESEEMSSANSQILEAITNLNTISQGVNEVVDQIADGSDEVNQGVTNIVELSEENRSSIDSVQRAGGQFSLSEGEAAAVMRLGHYAAAGHPCDVAATNFAGRVEERTRAAVKIGVYPESQLGIQEEFLCESVDGMIDMSLPTQATLDQISKKFATVMLPFFYESYEHAHRVLDGPFLDWKSKDLERQGLVVLSNWEWGGVINITNVVRRIRAVKDVPGLTIRTPAKVELQWAMKALGAEPASVPLPELRGVLERGAVQGKENPLR